MKNLWSDRDAKAAIKHYAKQGVNEDLAVRTYTTRLLGGVPALVQHGGGNTSVKTRMRDILGNPVDVLCVKGSGWDMAVIEPPGLPAVRLKPLQALIDLKALTDEEMVNIQRCNLLDSTSPNPSVETLFHAFLPHKFIDHTHADAVLALTDQPDGIAQAKKLFGKKLAIVEYEMPGFGLAKKAAEAFKRQPDAEGLVLVKHGIFTWGDNAKQAYDRMIHYVSMAERFLAKGRKQVFVQAKLPKKIAAAEDVMPILRGLIAIPTNADDGQIARWVFDRRQTPEIDAFVNGRQVGRYSQAGTVTPDHVIRTKPWPVVLPAPEAGKLDEFASRAKQAIDGYIAKYKAYFERHNATAVPKKIMLDPMPRALLVPGLGLIGVGKSRKDASIAADIAQTAVAVITRAEAIGKFTSIAERDIFDVEYWSLEQAKLGKGGEKPLARQVVVVTGGAGAIGAATAKAFAAEGAEVAVLDLDGTKAAEIAKKLGGIGIACDVTKQASVNAAFAKVAAHFGGVDILVSNAGAAWGGRIGEVSDESLRKSFDLNFFSHQYAAQAAVAIMLKQKTGGCLLFNASKQAVNPGPDFGPYGLPKAATLFLSRQYALDYGAAGIRSSAVNADRIRSGLLTDDMVAKRSKARGLSEKEYMSGNLLGREVKASDVAQAFVQLAVAQKTTGAVATVDGGNIAAALR
ncbi:bifunctional aldolase/short-chain dehydrogenase [Ferrovibrio sp.]|uniref:bifunctional aldolase/short-chain dehydrogenase n=1 Tax=Ferrovibrio sp. TaxID=1917215 RepID=UPI0025BABD7D|nr:bifunctional aldolase/short-chain dehydrogenase [Ferrovibrio sp.]MBX3456205.1 bifunctional aldolase/short-chain dehydrogenase [Ferrovibrio sp.]